MLGAAQLAWLLDGVAASTARWCVVLSSVPLDFVQSVDTWESFARERDLVRDALDPTRVIVVSGDQHYVAKHVHASGLREYVCGPLAAGLGSLPDPVPPEVEVLIATRNFLLLEIADSPTPTLTLSAVSGDGEVVMRETLPA
jgi:hypothetical protein